MRVGRETLRCRREDVVGVVLGVRHSAQLGQVDRALQNATTLSGRGENAEGSTGVLGREVGVGRAETAAGVRCDGDRALNVVCTARRREDHLVVALGDAVLLVDTRQDVVSAHRVTRTRVVRIVHGVQPEALFRSEDGVAGCERTGLRVDGHDSHVRRERKSRSERRRVPHSRVVERTTLVHALASGLSSARGEASALKELSFAPIALEIRHLRCFFW